MQADRTVAILVLLALSVSAFIPVALASHGGDHRDGATIGDDSRCDGLCEDWTDGPDNMATWNVYGINRSQYIRLWQRDLQVANNETVGQNPWTLDALKQFVDDTDMNQQQKNLTVQYFQLAAGSDFSELDPLPVAVTWNNRDHANATLTYGPKTKNYSNYSSSFQNYTETIGGFTLDPDENYPDDTACIRFPDRDNSFPNKPDNADQSVGNQKGYDPTNPASGIDAVDRHCFYEDVYVDEHSVDRMVVLHEKNYSDVTLSVNEPEDTDDGVITRFIPNNSTARVIADYRVNVSPSQYPNEYDQAEFNYSEGGTIQRVLKSYYTVERNIDDVGAKQFRVTSDPPSDCSWNKDADDACVYGKTDISNPNSQKAYAPEIDYDIEDSSVFGGFTQQEFNYQMNLSRIYTRHNVTCVVVGNPDDDDGDDDPDVGPYVTNENKYRDGYDSDEDGLDDEDETNNYGTDPDQTDTDGDGLDDDEEVFGPTDPLDDDTDGDGVEDGADDCPTDAGDPDNDGCPTSVTDGSSSSDDGPTNSDVVNDIVGLAASMLANAGSTVAAVGGELGTLVVPLGDIATAVFGASAAPEHDGPEHNGGPHWEYMGDTYNCKNDDVEISGPDSYDGSGNAMRDDDELPSGSDEEDPETDEVFVVLDDEPSEVDMGAIRRQLWNNGFGGNLNGDPVVGGWDARSSYRQNQYDNAVSGENEFGGWTQDKTYAKLDTFNVEDPDNVTRPWQNEGALNPHSVYNPDRPTGLRDYQVAQYPDGDIGVHIETTQPWRRITLHNTSYGLTSGWYFFSARNDDYDKYFTLKNETDDLYNRDVVNINNSTTHPVKIHGYPTRTGPVSAPPSSPIANGNVEVVSVNDSTTISPPNLKRQGEQQFAFARALDSETYTQAKDVTFRYDRDGFASEATNWESSPNRIRVEHILRGENETLGYNDSNVTEIKDTYILSDRIVELNESNNTAIIQYIVYKEKGGDPLNISRWKRSEDQDNPCIRPEYSGYPFAGTGAYGGAKEPTTDIENGAGYMTGEGYDGKDYGMDPISGEAGTGEVVLEHNLSEVNGKTIDARFVPAQWWDTPACYPKQTPATVETEYRPSPVFTGLFADLLTLLVIFILISISINWVYKAAGSKKEKSFFVWFYELMKETFDSLIRGR